MSYGVSVFGIFYGDTSPLPSPDLSFAITGEECSPDPGCDRYAYCSCTNSHGHRDWTKTQWKTFACVLSDSTIDAIFSHYGDPGTLQASILQEAEIREIWESDLGYDPEDLLMGVLWLGDTNDESDYFPYTDDYNMKVITEGDPEGLTATASTSQYRGGETICIPIAQPESSAGAQRVWWNLNNEAVRRWASLWAKKRMERQSTHYLFLDNAIPYPNSTCLGGAVSYYEGADETEQIETWASRFNQVVTAINSEVALYGCLVNGLLYGLIGYHESVKIITEYWQGLGTCYITGGLSEDAWIHGYYNRYVDFWRGWIEDFKAAGWKFLFSIHWNSYFNPNLYNEEAWLWAHLVGDSNVYLYIGESYAGAMPDYTCYSLEFGSSGGDPYNVGDFWYRDYDCYKITFDAGSINTPPDISYEGTCTTTTTTTSSTTSTTSTTSSSSTSSTTTSTTSSTSTTSTTSSSTTTPSLEEGYQKVTFCIETPNTLPTGTDLLCSRELTACYNDPPNVPGNTNLETYHADCDDWYEVCWSNTYNSLVADIPDDCCVTTSTTTTPSTSSTTSTTSTTSTSSTTSTTTSSSSSTSSTTTTSSSTSSTSSSSTTSSSSSSSTTTTSTTSSTTSSSTSTSSSTTSSTTTTTSTTSSTTSSTSTSSTSSSTTTIQGCEGCCEDLPGTLYLDYYLYGITWERCYTLTQSPNDKCLFRYSTSNYDITVTYCDDSFSNHVVFRDFVNGNSNLTIDSGESDCPTEDVQFVGPHTWILNTACQGT